MILFATDKDTPMLRKMWKNIFNDTDEFISLHFSRKYKAENTLVWRDGSAITACLQMFTYEFRFWGKIVPIYYLGGLCTLPEYRGRGIMGNLINCAHNVMRERNIPLSILVPASETMYDYYQRFGYEQVFEKSEEIIPLKEILQSSENLQIAYQKFDSIYRQKDFCIQKTFEDFEAIVADWQLDTCPNKTNIAGMACAIDPKIIFPKQKMILNLMLE